MLIRFLMTATLLAPLALPQGGRGVGGEGGPSGALPIASSPSHTLSSRPSGAKRSESRDPGDWAQLFDIRVESPRPVSWVPARKLRRAANAAGSASVRDDSEGIRAFASSREPSSPPSQKPHRIVSTNLCADQLALLLADRDRVVSVSRMSVEPQISNFADVARTIPINNARAEEIVELHPDLILGDVYTGKGANRLASTLGVPVHIIGWGSSIDDVRAIIADAAAAVGEPERGGKIVAEMDARIARAKAIATRPVAALVYEPNGITSSNGTLTHDVLTAAGLTNMAPKLMQGSYGAVPLEAVVAAAPELLVLDDSYAGTSSRAQSILRHPAFKSLEARTTRFQIPSRLWICPGPWVAEAVERLAAERARLARGAKRE